MTRFSIIIPVYQAERCLEDCLRSVQDQTREDYQVLLIDDGSTDRSPEICAEWACRDPRFTVLHRENGGAGAARNTGLAHAKGEYILFLDSDDRWTHSRVLEELDAQLRRTPVDVLCFNFRKSTDGKPGPVYFPSNIPSSDIPESLPRFPAGRLWVSCPWNKAVRRSLLCRPGLEFRTGITAEDMDWALRLALRAETFGYCPVDGVEYRLHPGSVSHSGSPDKVRCLLENVRECVRLLEQAEAHKAAALAPYVAYQYGVLLHNTALLPRPQQRDILPELESLAWLLDHSQDPKLRLLRGFRRFLGFPGTLLLLKLRHTMQVNAGKEVSHGEADGIYPHL